ncbi:MAG: EF-hand domain-containing protein [Sphingomonas sp.]
MRFPLFITLAAIALPVLAQSTGGQVAIPAGPAPGQPMSIPPPATLVAEPVAMMIAGCDANGDALVTRDELTNCVARSFAAVDSEHKGALGYIAFSDWALLWLGDRTALPSPFETDSNGDNRVSLVELQAKFDGIFDRLDKDKDGKLTRSELLTIRNGLNPSDGTGRSKKRR